MVRSNIENNANPWPDVNGLQLKAAHLNNHHMIRCNFVYFPNWFLDIACNNSRNSISKHPAQQGSSSRLPLVPVTAIIGASNGSGSSISLHREIPYSLTFKTGEIFMGTPGLITKKSVFSGNLRYPATNPQEWLSWRIASSACIHA